MVPKPLPDRRPSHHSRHHAAKCAAAPIAIMPAASHSPGGISKIHGGKSYGSTQTLTAPTCDREVG